MAPTDRSRYWFSAGLLDEDGALYLTEPDPYPYRVLSDTIEHVAVDGDTWWGLAGKYYAEIDLHHASELYWVICDFQPTPIVDPTIAIEAGTTIYIPSPRTVKEEIFNELRSVEFEA